MKSRTRKNTKLNSQFHDKLIMNPTVVIQMTNHNELLFFQWLYNLEEEETPVI
jgi:hypothetical protein